jgi:hypothetical protein
MSGSDYNWIDSILPNSDDGHGGSKFMQNVYGVQDPGHTDCAIYEMRCGFTTIMRLFTRAVH